MFTYKDVFSSFDVVLKDDIITDDKGDTLLHWACNNNDIKTAKMLINGNGVLNIQNGVGDTPLHIACKNDNYKMVKLLLFAGCKLSISNDAGMTPLHIAFYRQNYEIAKMLLEHGANFDIKDNFGRSPLQFIISKNSQPLKILKSNILTLRLLCEKYNFKGIEDFIEKNTSNLYKILAIKFLLSSNLKRYKKIDSFDIRQKNVLLRSIVRQTNVLDALRWSIHNDDFNVFHVILRSPNVTLYDLTTRFGQDMTIIDLAYSVNHHAAEFLKAKKLLLEKNAGWENKHIRKISEQDLDKNNNSSQIQKVSETKPKDSNILKSFLNMFGY